MKKSDIAVCLKKLVFLLTSGEFQEIADRNQNGRLTVDEIRLAIAEYPGQISMPPDEAIDNFELYAVHNLETESRNAEFNLWFDDMQSDLTMSFNVSKGQDGKPRLEVDDIHVL